MCDMIKCNKRKGGFMDNQNFMAVLDLLKQILLTVIPSVFAIYLFKLSSNKDIQNNFDKILNERMRNLYIPLYQRYMRGTLPRTMINLDTHNPVNAEKWTELFNFLIDNIHFMGSESQKDMHRFNYQMVELMLAIAKTTLDLDEKLIVEFDIVYKELMSNLFKEYTDICNKLGLPKPVIYDF